MGIDFLDLSFRLEESFGVKLTRADTNRLPRTNVPDISAGDLHEWLVQILKERGLTVPYSSWNRLRLALSRVVRKPPQVIHRDTLIIRDLGFS